MQIIARATLQVTRTSADAPHMMPTLFHDPVTLIGVAGSAAGVLLIIQARVQTKLLRNRIASGAGSIAVDPATGLFSAAATDQCVRAESNRAMRLKVPLTVWVGTAGDAAQLDEAGRTLAYAMPSGAMGVRIDRTRICVLSCAGRSSDPAQLLDDLTWSERSIEPGADAARDVLVYLSGVRHE